MLFVTILAQQNLEELATWLDQRGNRLYFKWHDINIQTLLGWTDESKLIRAVELFLEAYRFEEERSPFYPSTNKKRLLRMMVQSGENPNMGTLLRHLINQELVDIFTEIFPYCELFTTTITSAPEVGRKFNARVIRTLAHECARLTHLGRWGEGWRHFFEHAMHAGRWESIQTVKDYMNTGGNYDCVMHGIWCHERDGPLSEEYALEVWKLIVWWRMHIQFANENSFGGLFLYPSVLNFVFNKNSGGPMEIERIKIILQWGSIDALHLAWPFIGGRICCDVFEYTYSHRHRARETMQDKLQFLLCIAEKLAETRPDSTFHVLHETVQPTVRLVPAKIKQLIEFILQELPTDETPAPEAITDAFVKGMDKVFVVFPEVDLT